MPEGARAFARLHGPNGLSGQDARPPACWYSVRSVKYPGSGVLMMKSRWATEASSGMELLKVPPAAKVPVATPVLAARCAVNIKARQPHHMRQVAPPKPLVYPSYTPRIPLVFYIRGVYDGFRRGLGGVYAGFKGGYCWLAGRLALSTRPLTRLSERFHQKAG